MNIENLRFLTEVAGEVFRENCTTRHEFINLSPYVPASFWSTGFPYRAFKGNFASPGISKLTIAMVVISFLASSFEPIYENSITVMYASLFYN